ncbi:hypothetical protein K440DRAFT_57302 [Wilcoxina mikolae CBS 423.85]|nr:hypothetical protein K440DRAFT_57302 [Wilcoxina mikolae CBS 423.85]
MLRDQSPKSYAHFEGFWRLQLCFGFFFFGTNGWVLGVSFFVRLASVCVVGAIGYLEFINFEQLISSGWSLFSPISELRPLKIKTTYIQPEGWASFESRRIVFVRKASRCGRCACGIGM